MTVAVVLAAALLGAVGGAALPIAAYRLSVPWRGAGEESTPARTACAVCAGRLPPGVPGWLRLGAGCPHCGARLGPRTWLLAVLGGAGAAGLAWQLGPAPELVPYVFGLLLGILLGAVDLSAQRLPDILVYPGIAVTAVLFGGVALANREWAALGRALLAAAILFGVYLVLALLPGAAIGGGDLGLAALLGLYLGWVGWPVLVLGATLPWLLQGIVSLGLVLRRRAEARTMLPFGPAMLVGAYAVLVVLPGISRLVSV